MWLAWDRSHDHHVIPHAAIRDLATPVIIESTMARIALFARVRPRFDVSFRSVLADENNEQ